MIWIIRFDIGQQRTVEMEIDPAQRRPGDVWSSRNGPPHGYEGPTESHNDMLRDEEKENGEAEFKHLKRMYDMDW